ncbi:hypothetical protein D3C81_2081370 [compost metagenome]
MPGNRPAIRLTPELNKLTTTLQSDWADVDDRLPSRCSSSLVLSLNSRVNRLPPIGVEASVMSID